MNYDRCYERLIQRARGREAVGYVERHHIVPVCIGGTDGCVNIVRLTPEEHYVAHQLLVKIYPHVKSLMWATMVMTGGRSHQPRRNKLYGWLRRRVSLMHTGVTKSPETRAKLSAANKGKRFSPERCANISAAKIGKKQRPRSQATRDIVREKLRAANVGKIISPEAREKMRAAKLGRKLTAEHCEKVAASLRGKKRSLEARANMVAAWEVRKRRQRENRV